MASPTTPFSAHDHGACTHAAMAEAERLVREKGVRMTPVRRRTLELLLETHRAMGAYEVLDRLAQDGFGRQPPVAYRALEFLVEHGLAHRVQLLNAFAACAHPSRDHEPAFLICRACNLVAEAPAAMIRPGLDQAADGLGFKIERMSLEAVGLCPSCSQQDAA